MLTSCADVRRFKTSFEKQRKDDKQKSRMILYFPEFLVFLLVACISSQLKTLHTLDESIEKLFL